MKKLVMRLETLWSIVESGNKVPAFDGVASATHSAIRRTKERLDEIDRRAKAKRAKYGCAFTEEGGCCRDSNDGDSDDEWTTWSEISAVQ